VIFYSLISLSALIELSIFQPSAAHIRAMLNATEWGRIKSDSNSTPSRSKLQLSTWAVAQKHTFINYTAETHKPKTDLCGKLTHAGPRTFSSNSTPWTRLFIWWILV